MIKSAKLTEEQLFMLLKQKNELGFSYLYDRYAPLIYGILLRETKNTRLASEILKNTFVSIVNECDNLDCIKQSLFTWLLVLMKKTAREDFKVNIDFKSLLPPKVTAENHPQRTFVPTTDLTSPSAVYAFNQSI